MQTSRTGVLCLEEGGTPRQTGRSTIVWLICSKMLERCGAMVIWEWIWVRIRVGSTLIPLPT
jgi:hypothetical protein